MAKKSWHIDRRTMLRGTATAMALPLLEGMSWAKDAAAPPKRLCYVYIPWGVSSAWYPTATGKDYELTMPLEPLAPFKSQMSVITGLSNPKCRNLQGAHGSVDTFLTGAAHKPPEYRNTISVDQLAAKYIGGATRYSYLLTATNGGVGSPTRSATMAYTEKGRPIPTLADPHKIFDMLFGKVDEKDRQRMTATKSVLDDVREDAKSMMRLLGKHDRDKFDEYLSSVETLQKDVQRSQDWLNRVKPVVLKEAYDALDLNADPREAPESFVRTMFDLAHLALQTDSTRVVSYVLASMQEGNFMRLWPKILGYTDHDWHRFNHGNDKETRPDYDKFITEQFAYFLNRMTQTREGEGTLLDNTMILYGSSNSDKPHGTTNFPLILAGGKNLGLAHGSHHRYTDDIPLSNLHLTMLERLGVPVESFSDSTGMISEVVA
ncbi:MAG: DUF1552 domain-containing protein [Bythopirellula sp.]